MSGGTTLFRSKVDSPDGRSPELKSIGPMRICRSLTSKKGNKRGKTVTAHVESNGN